MGPINNGIIATEIRDFPENAVVVGVNKEGAHLYIARAFHDVGGNLHTWIHTFSECSIFLGWSLYVFIAVFPSWFFQYWLALALDIGEVTRPALSQTQNATLVYNGKTIEVYFCMFILDTEAHRIPP